MEFKCPGFSCALVFAQLKQSLLDRKAIDSRRTPSHIERVFQKPAQRATVPRATPFCYKFRSYQPCSDQTPRPRTSRLGLLDSPIGQEACWVT